MIEEELKTLINRIKKYNLLVGNNNKYKSNILDLFNKPIKDYLDDEDKLFILNSLISKKKECNVVEDDNINNNKNNTNDINNSNTNTNNTTPINENELIFDTLVNKLNFNVGDIILYTLDKNNNKYFLSKLDFFKKYIPSLDKIQLNELLIRSIKYDTSKDFNDYLIGLGADENILEKRIRSDTKFFGTYKKLFYSSKLARTRARDRVLIKYLLEELGHPERKIKNVIHITGSNGKGSTCHFLRYILEEQGYKVNVYTNPSIVHYSENYYIAGEYITDEKYDELLFKIKKVYDKIILRSDYRKEIEDVCDKYNLNDEKSKIEFMPSVAFLEVMMTLAFSESDADYSLIEVRFGGLKDVTNIFTENETIATILTYIQYGMGSNDGLMPFYHEDGRVEYSNRATAYHKAMLGKKNRPMIVANQTEDVLEEIRRVAKEEVGTYTIEYGRDWFIEKETKDDFIFKFKNKEVKINKSKTLLGDFQTKNIATALATLYTLQEQGKVKIDDGLLQKGVDNTRMFGRLSRVMKGNYVNYFNNDNLEIISGVIKLNDQAIDGSVKLIENSCFNYIVYTCNDEQHLKGEKFLEQLTSLNSKKYKLIVYKKNEETFEHMKEQLENNNLNYVIKMSLSSALKYVKEYMKIRFKDKKTKSKSEGRKLKKISDDKKIKLFVVCESMEKYDGNIEYMN